MPLPRRWVVERSSAWVTPFRRSVKDYERLPETVAGLHLVASVYLSSTERSRCLGRAHNSL